MKLCLGGMCAGVAELEDAVFISHTGQDEYAAICAAFLEHDLRGKGINVFLDATDLLGGVRWRETITRNILRCKVVVVFLNPKYPTRKWPLLELHLALKNARRRHIVPVLFGVDRGSIDEHPAEWTSAWEKLEETDPGLLVDPAKDLDRLLRAQAIDGTDASKGTQKGKTAMPKLVDHISRRVSMWV
jgi:hypothetical protein